MLFGMVTFRGHMYNTQRKLTLKYFNLLVDEDLVNVNEILQSWGAVTGGVSGGSHPLHLYG